MTYVSFAATGPGHLEVTSTKVSYSQTLDQLSDSLSSIKTGPCNRRQIPNSAAEWLKKKRVNAVFSFETLVGC